MAHLPWQPFNSQWRHSPRPSPATPTNPAVPFAPSSPNFHGPGNLILQYMPLTGVRPIPDPEAKLGMDPPGHMGQ